MRCLGMDTGGTAFYKSKVGRASRGSSPRCPFRGGRSERPRIIEPKGIQLSDTIHLHDLTPAERLLEEAAERGFVEETEIEALADEHELQEEELAALRVALEERDVVVRAAAPEKEAAAVGTGAATGTLDPLQLFMDAAGRYKLLTAAD